MRIRHQKSIDRFKDTIRRKTRRRIPLHTVELIHELNPVIRGWGEYYKRAHVRRLFNQLDCWMVRRIVVASSSTLALYGVETAARDGVFVASWGLVSLVSLIPSLRPRPRVEPS